MTEKQLPIATHDGTLELGNQKISCAVLDNGSRVLIERSVAIAIGRRGGGTHWQKKKEAAPILPEYISAKYLEPYISGVLKEKLLAPIKYVNKSGEEVIGINATLLPEICDVWLKARDAGILKEGQIDSAKKADILIRALATIGITALVDEATGYIKDKKKSEYIDLFKQFVANEAKEWQKEFPEPFFDMVYKIYGKTRTTSKGQHPQYFGYFIRKYVYQPLAGSDGVILEMLEEKNPKVITKSGTKIRKKKLFQFLEDIGTDTLRRHIWRLIGIGDASESKAEFERKFAKVFPAKNQQLDLLDQ